jgi:hypothetical protein
VAFAKKLPENLHNAAMRREVDTITMT